MVAIKASWPLRLPARAILAAFPSAQPSSGRWLRWLCPSHPPGRKMAVIQPSQPFGRRMAVANSTQPSRRPDTSPGGSTLAPRATTPCSGWLASLSLSHRVGTLGQDLVSLAILRPMAATAVCQPSCGRADGRDTAIAAIGRRMAALTGTQPKWRVLVGRSGQDALIATM